MLLPFAEKVTQYNEPLLGEQQEFRPNAKRIWKASSFWIYPILLGLNLALLPLSFYAGYQTRPRSSINLPIYNFVKKAIYLEIRRLDDEIHLADQAGEVYKGDPRPELDDAWRALFDGYNVRIPGHVAKAANFTSLTLADGSGDVMATPAVFHELHCIRSLRQAMFPEAYPEHWQEVRPPGPGKINGHLDHCLDILRQSTMCHGDMTFYGYKWEPDWIYPQPVGHTPRVCANWERLQGWAVQHEMDIFGNLLQHPTLGIPWPKTDPQEAVT